MAELVLAAALISSVVAYRSKLIGLHEGQARRGEQIYQYVYPDGIDDHLIHDAYNNPKNKDYRQMTRGAVHLPLANKDALIFTPAGEYLLRDPEFKKAYFANYVRAVDRDHTRLQLPRQKYLYSTYRPVIREMGSADDMGTFEIYQGK